MVQASIQPGQRAILAGRTGSGKSTLARYLLLNSPNHWVILNPKHTQAYKKLPDSITLNSMDYKKIEREMMRHRFVIVNPKQSEATPDGMDDLVQWMHDEYKGIGLCCDELYTLHRNGVAGEGLLSYLTRGRELNQSFLGQTQRPAWVSQFLFSESDFIVEMSLNLKKDRMRMFEFIGHDAALAKLPPREWLWYDASGDVLRKFAPVVMP